MDGGPCCEVCGGQGFESSEGLFFCLECGTQSQDFREEKSEETVESFVRTLKAPSAKKKSVPSKGGADVTLLQKFQVVLQKQCDALIGLGYDKSVKEAVKCLWFIYLKKFGYGFLDDLGSAAAASPVTPMPQNRKRSRHSGDDDPLPTTPKRPRSSATDNGEASVDVVFDEFPVDSALFECSQGSTRVEGGDAGQSNATTADVSGNEAFLLNRAKKMNNVRSFSVRHTVGLVYLGLRYTHQKILLPDFTRLVATNKVPYYNLHVILPGHLVTGIHSISTYASQQITSDKIHVLSQVLYKALPLPSLPVMDPKWVCHRLLDRLQLPGSFRVMVERALGEVYWPEYRKCMDPTRWRERRLDLECMGVIICVMKMVYRLDGVREFEQASKAVPVEECAALLGGSGYVYPWEDWVTVFCRHMQRSLDNDVPLNTRELDYVSDCQPFLDFCREEVLLNVRPKARAGDKVRRYYFCPDYYARISEGFKKVHQSYLQDQQKMAAEDPTGSRESLYSWDNFSPRLIPCSALLADLEHAPWKQYAPIPTTSNDPRLDLEQLPSSMALLLELCSDVVDTTVLVLMRYVRDVEWYIIQESLPAFQQRATKDDHDPDLQLRNPDTLQTRKPRDSATKEPHDSATEEPQDSATEEPQDSATEEPQDSATEQDSTTEEPRDSATEQDSTTEEPQDSATEQDSTTEEPRDSATEEPQDSTTKEPQDSATKEPQDSAKKETPCKRTPSPCKRETPSRVCSRKTPRPCKRGTPQPRNSEIKEPRDSATEEP